MATVVFVWLALAASASAQDESLGEYARKVRTPKKLEVLVSAEQGKLLFKSVDAITQFSSQDSGLPKLGAVKRTLIGHAEAERHFKQLTEKEAQHERRMDEAALVLKKFGMLPAQFELSAALGDYTLNNLAGFYDFNDKTMYLLNWVAPELQKMVMAHELTHALQDQSYTLATFVNSARPAQEMRQMSMERDDAAELSIAHRAVVEGQATLVGLDYILKDAGISLATSPRARQLAGSLLQGSYSPPVTIHNAPRLLREVMIFPYREGLLFELELLTHGGRQQAFQGAFKRPPLNTHQILQPEAYFKNEKSPRVPIGDLASVFGEAYEAYDSGSIGEFDVQIMAQDFGRENDIYTVARQWNGGSYVAVKRTGLAADAKLTTADLALVYLSRWNTRQAAERFGQIYLQAIAKRLSVGATNQQRCDEETCPGPLWEQHAQSSEGPVNIELWPGNLLIITHGVDEARMLALRPLLLAPAQTPRASLGQPELEQPELAPRLLSMPQIQALSEQAGGEIYQQLRQLLLH
jgi:hypothetical protein